MPNTSTKSWTQQQQQRHSTASFGKISSSISTKSASFTSRNIPSPSFTDVATHSSATSSFQQQYRHTSASAISKFEFLSVFSNASSLNGWIDTTLTISIPKTTTTKGQLIKQKISHIQRMKNTTRHTNLPTREEIELWSIDDHTSFIYVIGQHSVGTIPSIIRSLQYASICLMSSNNTTHPDKTSSSIEIYKAAFQALQHQKSKLQQQQQQQQQHRNQKHPYSNTLKRDHERNTMQKACMDIVHRMEKDSIITSSKFMTMLLPIYCGYTSRDPIQLWRQLLEIYPNLTWSESTWNVAIEACSWVVDISCDDESMDFSRRMRATTTKDLSSSRATAAVQKYDTATTIGSNSKLVDTLIWESAEQIYFKYLTSMMQTSNIRMVRPTYYAKNIGVTIPSERICMTMMQICVMTKNVTNTVTFLDRILHPDVTIQSPHSTEKTNFRMTPRLWAMLLKVCAVAGDHTMAYELLRRMGQNENQPPNVRHCTTYLKALIEAKELNVAVRFLDYMSSNVDEDGYFSNLRIKVLPDMVAVKTVLNGSVSAGIYSLARQVCNNIKNGSYGDAVQMDEQCYNMLLSACPDSMIAKELLREIRLTRRYRIGVVRPSAITYTKAIAVCRKSFDVDTARLFITMAKGDNIPPDSFMYSSAIWIAAQCNDAKVAMELLNDMIDSNTTPTIVSYNGVFSALASSGCKSDTMVTTFQGMKRTFSHIIQPNVMTYFHIARCLQKIKEDEERLAYLWRIYVLMDSHDRHVTIGGRLLESLIQTYGALGHFNEAMEVFQSIRGLSNSECLRAILFACSVADPPEWEMALTLLHASDIVDGGIGPGLVESGALCNAMLACSKAGQWEESLQLMRLYGGQCDVSIMAINSLIAACGRAGRPDMSMEILYEVEGRGLKLDTRSYRNTIIACNQAEHVYQRSLQQQDQQKNQPGMDKRTFQIKNEFAWWECAISLLRRMKESGLQPDTPTLSSTISACEAAGQWQRALYILQSAMNDNLTVALNVYCFNAAISACEKGGAWVEALEIYEKMKEQGGYELRPNPVTVSSLILALDNAGQKEFAVNIYREGLRKRYIQSPWRTTNDSIRTEPVVAMDLHSYSAAMARAAIRNHMNTLSQQGQKASIDMQQHGPKATFDASSDWIIIVGQGYHSLDGRPILKDAVLNLLIKEYGIKAVVDERNFGRVLIPFNSIRQFVSKRRWH